MNEFTALLKAKSEEAGRLLTDTQLAQFSCYYEMLVKTNKALNLTALTAPADVALKHMVDSLLAYTPEMFHGKQMIDVGTGAGFPGLPLKIYDPSIRLVLLDSLEKRLNFLRQVVSALGLSDVTFIHARAEDAGRDKALRGKFDVATARAVANLSVLAEYCLPLVRTGGYMVALKGSKYGEELEDARRAIPLLGGELVAATRVVLPGLADGRAIVCIRKKRPTPAAYPRKAGTPAKKPL